MCPSRVFRPPQPWPGPWGKAFLAEGLGREVGPLDLHLNTCLVCRPSVSALAQALHGHGPWAREGDLHMPAELRRAGSGLLQ